jgi:uncharacterized membrane protein
MPPIQPIHLNEIHPMLVHFPIALLLASVVLDLLAALTLRCSLADAAFICLFLGVIGAAAAGLTGPLAEQVPNVNAAGTLLHWHKLFAYATVAVFGLLLVARIIWSLPRLTEALGQTLPERIKMRYPTRLPRLAVTGYLLLALLGSGLLGATGYFGGAMVYDRGVGTHMTVATPSDHVRATNPQPQP